MARAYAGQRACYQIQGGIMATIQRSTATRISDIKPWPTDRPTAEVIAERLLASALYNYHRVMTRPEVGLADFRQWDELSETQQEFLLDYAIPAAMQAIWKGR